MTNNDILKTDLLDILFQNRNKAYGAYTLRKYYGQRLWLALFFSLSLSFLILYAGSNYFAKPQGNAPLWKADEGLILRTHDIPPPPKEVPPAPPAPKAPKASTTNVAQKQFVDIIKITADPVDNVVPTQTDLTDKLIGSTNIAGAPATGTETPVVQEGTGHAQAAPAAVAPPLPSAAPQFPGGIDAWTRFLNRNLQVPDELASGEKKVVLVRFWVSTDGSVTSFEVVQSGGASFDAEVLRVMRKMPRWKPAVQNGQNIAVTFTQPVTFMGVD